MEEAVWLTVAIEEIDISQVFEDGRGRRCSEPDSVSSDHM